jgi:hypothetical protein
VACPRSPKAEFIIIIIILNFFGGGQGAILIWPITQKRKIKTMEGSPK